MSFDARFDTVLASVQLHGLSLSVTTICGMPDRFRALVLAPDGRTVADVTWPGSPLGAAEEARSEALLAVGVDLYEVSLWCSRPGTNDDCTTGQSFESLAAARACFDDPWATFNLGMSYYTAYIALARKYRLNGFNYADELGVRQNPGYDAARVERQRRRDDAMARNERAMQSGMAFGCEGYNDEMGW